MVINIHLDASYLSETRARSCVAELFFLGSKSVPNLTIKLNRSLFVMCGVLKFVVALATEAELGALFINCKEGRIIRLNLNEMDHTQPPKPLHCGNMKSAGIANDTVKNNNHAQWKCVFPG